MSERKCWSRDELMIAMNLYCKLSFGQIHQRTPIIIEVSQKLGRTPSSLAMKLVNFASLDPDLQARGVKGLQGASQADRAIWNEFHKNWDDFGYESEEKLQMLFNDSPVEIHSTRFKYGLCLSKTQDAAFDRGLITINSDYKIILSSYIRDFLPERTLDENFGFYSNQQINLPEKFMPHPDFLAYHMEEIFIG